MPIVRETDAILHDAHGSTFAAFVAPSLGSSQLCAWSLTVPANLPGVPHRPNREEVLLVLAGELTLTLDGVQSMLRAGDVAVFPAGGEVCVDSGPAGASAWVTTTPGLEAVLPDGSRLSPPWAR